MTDHEEITTPSSPLEKESPWGTKKQSGYSYTGNMTDFRISTDGKIVRWEFFSLTTGSGALQVWRQINNNTNM